jgi:hypothetical protein
MVVLFDCDRTPLFLVFRKHMLDSIHPPAREPLIRGIAMPADAKLSGDFFGRRLMSPMGLAAAKARCLHE